MAFYEVKLSAKDLPIYPQKLKVRKEAKALQVVLKIVCNPTYSV